MAGIRAKNIELGSGVAATRATLAVMRNVALSASQDPNVRAVAMQIIAGLPSRAYLSEAQAISNFVRDRVRYTRDPQDMELLQDPAFILDLGSDPNPAPMQGDCDDKVTLLAALLMSVGFPGVHFIAVGDDKNVYTHVLLEVNVNGTWYPAETCPDPLNGSVPFGQQAREFPYNLVYDVASGQGLNGLGTTSARPNNPVRGKSPYAGINVGSYDPSSTPNATLQQWTQFLKTLSGEAAARIAEGQASYGTMEDALDRIYTGASLWAGFNTAPLPIPMADIVFQGGMFGTPGQAPAMASGGGGGGGGGGMGRKQLLGLDGAGVTFPVPQPPPGYSGKGASLGNGWYVLYGNTNGNPAIDMSAWLNYCIKSGGKYYASPAWVASGAIQTWDAGFEPQTRLATQITNIVAVAAAAVGIGEAAAAIDGTAAAGGAAGGSSTLAPTVVEAAAPTDAIAAPVAEVDTGLTASTIAPLTTADIGSVATTGAVAADAAGASAAQDVLTGAKAVTAVLGAGAIVAGVGKAASNVPAPAPATTTATAAPAGGFASFLSKYKLPLLLGTGLAVAYVVAG